VGTDNQRQTVKLLAAYAVVTAAALAPAQTAAQPASAAPAAAVTVVKVVKTCFSDTVDVTGQLAPREEVLVRPDREGLQVSQLMVEAGDTVAAGQVLVRLASSDNQQTANVTAPVAGIVRKHTAVVGAPASARGEPLFQIIAQGEIELQAGVVPSQLARLAVQQKATVRVVGMGEFAGQLRFISPAVDATTQLGSVRVAVTGARNLRVGTFARATIITGQRCSAAVPLSAVLYSREGAVVQAVREERVESRRVTLGLFSRNEVEVRQGLAEGEVVVQKAGAFLREGDRVKPITEGAK
jgi:HlyD family secretion protein